MKDTLRILVDWKCNLKCSYCCNEKPENRQQFRMVKLDDLDISGYRAVCISGGEPLLFPERIEAVMRKIPTSTLAILYTNGTMLNRPMANLLRLWGLDAINVGLHKPETFSRIISSVRNATRELGFSVRFHVWEKYRDTGLVEANPGVDFWWWTMDDCHRENEERVILEWSEEMSVQVTA